MPHGLKLPFRRSLRRTVAVNAEEDSDIALQREGLLQAIQSWRRKYLGSVSLPGLREALDADATPDKVENECLYLPSDFTVQERRAYGLDKLAAIERRVREREAMLAIRNLKNACRQVTFFDDKALLKTRKTTIATRSNTVLHKAREYKAFWMGEYQTVREILIALGMAEEHIQFRPLTLKDTVRPSTSIPSSLGKGGEAPGWIWTVATGQSKAEEEAWIREGQAILNVYILSVLIFVPDDRVQWFKHLAALMRWREETDLLEEEMRRFICGLDGMRRAWTTVHFQEELGGTSGKSAFAAAKVDFYGGMLFDARKHFRSLNIPYGRFTKKQLVSVLHYYRLAIGAHSLRFDEA